MIFNDLKYKFTRIKKYYDRRRLLKYLLLKIFRGYRILSETPSQRKIIFNFSNLIFEYPLDSIAYEISIDPQNEILVDSYIDLDEGTYIDVGAFIGKYTIKIGKNPNVKVLAIEPNPGSFNLLVNNIHLNGLDKNVIALNYALDEETDRILNLTDNYAMSSIKESAGIKVFKVKTKTLSSLITDYSLLPPYLIKIDTEGYELKILRSFEKYLVADIPIKLVVEILPRSTEKELLFQLIRRYNFKCEQIDYTNYFFEKILNA